MFSLKGTIMKALGLTENEAETDVEAWTRIQEAMDVAKASAALELTNAENNFSATVTALTERIDAQASQITSLTQKIEAAVVAQTTAIDELKAQFAKDIAVVKAGAPATTGEEMPPTPPTPETTAGKQVAAWKKPIVNVSQKA